MPCYPCAIAGPYPLCCLAQYSALPIAAACFYTLRSGFATCTPREE